MPDEKDKEKPQEKSWFELTSDEAMERLFGKKVVKAVKELFENDDNDEKSEPSIPQS